MKFLLFPLAACFLFSFTVMKKKTRVIFFGDSITEAAVQPTGYITQIQDSLKAQHLEDKFELLGAGVSGNKIYDLFFRLQTDVLDKKPDVVVIFVGVNDVWHKQTLGTGTDSDKFKVFYAAIIDKLQKKHIKVILCSPALIGERKSGANPLDGELDTYAQIVRDLAAEKNCGLADFRKAFVEYDASHNTSNRYSTILTTDGVHFNQQGNAMAASMLLEKIQSALLKR